jgi:hypothetical protein
MERKSMKHACFVCVFLYLTTTLLLSQSNLVPQYAGIASPPISAPQQFERRFVTGTHQTATAQTQGVVFDPVVDNDSGGTSTFSVAVADVNQDGKPDLIAANYGSNSVTVLLGNGDGTFQPAVTYSSGGLAAVSVAVADVNRDGKLDIVVANYGSNSVAVLLGNGDGTFQSAVTYGSGGLESYSVAVADVNRDGKPDILVANNCANSDCGSGTVNGNIGVLLGNGDGSFQPAAAYDSGGYTTTSVAVADVNGDDKPDLLVANLCASGSSNCPNGAVVVLLGNGDGTFQSAVSYDSGGWYSYSVAVADVNGDGKPDLLVANEFVSGNYYSGALGVLLGNGDGTFQSAVSYDSGGVAAVSVAAADVNGDGKPDLLVANCGTSGGSSCATGTVGVLLGNGDGTFQSVASYASGGFYANSVAVADVNGDGRPDLQVANRGSGTDGSVGVLISVSLTSTTTALVSTANPSAVGQSVAFTAAVTKQFGNGTPTGTVTFTYGSTTLCNAVTLSGGTATCAYSALPIGSDLLTATYSGDANFSGSSASLSQTVNQASTTLTLISSLNPSGLDSPVTFTVTIAPQYGGQATGTIIFKDGTTTLGSSCVVGNVASLTTSALAIGTHSVTATYSGDSNFTGSASNIVSQVVTKATTTTALVSSANPSVQGKSVTFTASVSSLAGTPTGKVQFLDGKTVLATVKLTSGSAKYTTSKLSPGANSITAVYEGDSENNGSTSPPVDQFVIATTTTALLSSPNPSTFGQVVTFTAVVAPAPPDGQTVSFMKGKTVLGTGTLSGGSATFATPTLKVGTTSVTAVYGGDSNFAGSKSEALKQVVEKAGGQR